jgi:pyruvate, water dikinase
MRVNSLFKHLTYRVFAPGAVLRKTYESFHDLLAYDHRCHELMAELESYYYQGIKKDFCKISKTYQSFAENVEGMVLCLEQMAPTVYLDLPAYFRKFNFYAGFFLEPPAVNIVPPFVLHFYDPLMTAELAGSKTSTLIELGDKLQLTIPDGFVITANSFSYLIEYNNLQSQINELLTRVELTDFEGLEEISQELQSLIVHLDIPQEISKLISKATTHLQNNSQVKTFAVRSSAMAEDGECSFAGQYLSCLDVPPDEIIASYKRVLSSKYSCEALVYRISRGLYDTEAAMAVMVLPMVDPVAAGVMYTEDVTGSYKESLSIHATDGLGDKVVSGMIIPDIYNIDKNTRIAAKEQECCHRHGKTTLSESQVNEIASAGIKIEHYYKEAQDIEWAIDQTGSLTFLQTRALSIPVVRKIENCDFKPDKSRELLSGGECASSGIATGVALGPEGVTLSRNEKQNIILILQETRPSFVKFLPVVKGVIAESGSGAGHFATVCREFAIPLLLGTGKRIESIEPGTLITLHADDKKVYDGKMQFLTEYLPAYKCEKELPFFRKLRSLLDFVTPLNLVDPTSDDFAPESCRSLHDIIRFCHEKAVGIMFSVGDQAGRSRGLKKKLETDLPFDVFLVDIDEGLHFKGNKQSMITIDDIACTPFLPLWSGLTHPAIEWGDKKYYDWKSYDRMAMSDAFVFQSENDSASYAVLGKHYLNINMRFGYHFTILDALCEPDSNSNYCSLRFAGGGGEFEGRKLRISFLSQILERLDFVVTVKGDLLDANLSHVSQKLLKQRLESLGRLLGLTKQMDMRLHDMSQVNEHIEQFFETL